MRDNIILIRRKITNFLRPFLGYLWIAAACLMFIPKFGVWINLNFFNSLIPYTDTLGNYCVKIWVLLLVLSMILDSDKQTSKEQAETDAILESNPELYISYEINSSGTYENSKIGSSYSNSRLVTDENGLAQIFHKKGKIEQTNLQNQHIAIFLGAVLFALAFFFTALGKIIIYDVSLRLILFFVSIIMVIAAYYPVKTIWGISISLVILTYLASANTTKGFEWTSIPSFTWVTIIIGGVIILGIKRILIPVYKQNEYNRNWREEYRKNQTNNKLKG
jgi:hypothetical protein